MRERLYIGVIVMLRKNDEIGEGIDRENIEDALNGFQRSMIGEYEKNGEYRLNGAQSVRDASFSCLRVTKCTCSFFLSTEQRYSISEYQY
jgi:hypothetical protein